MRIIHLGDFSTNKGFTLVELAIVITIIGLLIGGVLKGQEMINNARVTATIAQVNSYQAALEVFRDRYDQLPGDMPVAQRRLPGCTDASFCFNGDGNSRIGEVEVYGTDDISSENTQFWRHLAVADLISGVSPSGNQLAFGRSHPSTPVSGGFGVGTRLKPSPGHLPNLEGLVMRTFVFSGVCGAATADASRNCPVAPRDAALIDRKMDDGTATTGYVQSTSSGGSSGCGNINVSNGVISQGPNGYDETIARKNCMAFFKF